jgi:CHAT domain-containing protein
VLWGEGQYTRALTYFEQALAMYQDLADVFLAGASEAEAFSLAASLPLTCDGLLSVSGELPGTDDQSYRHVWRGKAAISRILQQRQQAVLAGSDPESRKAYQELQETRRALGRLILHPARDPKIHRQRLQDLSETKERLERELAAKLPEFRRQKALERLSAKDLIQKLLAGTVFIDFLRYVHFQQDRQVPGMAGEKRTPSYVAFLLVAAAENQSGAESSKRRSASITRVELGPAAPIEAALANWRRAIADKKASAAPLELRRLLWQPLARHLPADTQTVLIAPDAALSTLPWAALPGRKNDTVLLEDYALAVLPHGPFLLDRLTAPPSGGPTPGADASRSAGLLLAVGGVTYDQEPSPVYVVKEDLLVQRSAERGDKGVTWPELPGTGQELEKVIALAGSRKVRRLSGNEASTAQLLADMPQARWVHLATHGFFAEARFRSVLQIDEKLFERRAFREGPAPGARNPLVLSGIVLAGANLPIKDILHDDGGILTAEAIAGLPLQNLELAVLSACETGLGEVAGGEGVFGLQRAFHLAGARSVVASLWKVSDRGTQLLMTRFYENLWQKKMPKLEALREAQLWMLRELPKQPELMRSIRGLELVENQNPDREGRLPPYYWAAFVLSGDWR